LDDAGSELYFRVSSKECRLNNFYNPPGNQQNRRRVSHPDNNNKWRGQSMARPVSEKRPSRPAFNSNDLISFFRRVRYEFARMKYNFKKIGFKVPAITSKPIKSPFRKSAQNFNPSEWKFKSDPLKSGFSLINVLGILFIIFASLTLITGLVVVAKYLPSKDKAVAAQPKEEAYMPVVVTPNFNKQIKVLILGSDLRPNDGSFRTDAIMMVVLDPDKMNINVVSFPRDLWVQVPSLWEMKINQVFQLGEFDAMAEMFETNFGLRPDFYVMTNFNGFTQFIDNRGGLDVNVASDFSDECSLPNRDEAGNCSVSQGVVHMDGATSLWYVRARSSSNDLDRNRREQEVLYALAKKMVSFQSLTKLASMKDEIQDNVQTNMTIEQAMQLMPFVGMVLNQPEKINSIAIGEDHAYPSWSWDGMWILMPDNLAIQELFRQAGIIQ
jgi:LCP family protein required for cell wall assembly